MAANLDLIVDMGADFEVDLVYRNYLGAPVDLSGYTAHLQVKTTALAMSADLDLDEGSTNGGISLGGAAGTISIAITKVQSLALSPGANVYDLFLTSGGGVTTRILYGSLTAVQNVTV